MQKRNRGLEAITTNELQEINTRSPEALLAITEQKSAEIQEALAVLREMEPNA